MLRRGETRGEENKDAHGLETVLLEQQFLVTTKDSRREESVSLCENVSKCRSLDQQQKVQLRFWHAVRL
jgi:hypothetical protein